MIIEGWHQVPEAARGATIALGNMDGVHLGRKVLRAANAAQPDLKLAALTFNPIARAFPPTITLPPDPAPASAALAVAGQASSSPCPSTFRLRRHDLEAFVEVLPGPRCEAWPAGLISPLAIAVAATPSWRRRPKRGMGVGRATLAA